MYGARNYDELCIAAKNEEKRLAELEKRQQYGKSQSSRYSNKDKSPSQGFGQNVNRANQFYKQQPRCYVCNSPNHLARDCRAQKSESERKTSLSNKTKVVRGGRLSRGSSPEMDNFQEIVKTLFPPTLTTA